MYKVLPWRSCCRPPAVGNELYSAQGMPRFPNSSAYGAAMVDIIACARALMPHAKIAAVGKPGAWNSGLRPYLHLLDGVSHHTYSPHKSTVQALPRGQQLSFIAGYSRAGLRSDIAAQKADLGVTMPMWVTEFGVGLDADDDCLLPELIFGSIHGAFHAARVIAAINEEAGALGALCFERFVFADPQTTNQPNDWCGMPAGTVQQDKPNRPDLARITGEGQLVSHLFGRALASELMHPVNISGGQHALPMMPTPILGELQPCLQAAAFTGTTTGVGEGAGGGASGLVVAVLNICNRSIALTINGPGAHAPLEPAGGRGTAIWYDLLDPGGKAPLPSEPESFPWSSGPLRGRQRELDGSVYTAPPMSFAIVEL